MTSSSKHRSRDLAEKAIAFSISYQRENLLARGMGVDHLRDLLLRLARMLVRRGANLAYGGHWRDTADNFTLDLLRLINAEQEDNALAGPDSSLRIGRLYNHSAWPHYLEVTPGIEAQWINSCRIVRITQQLAQIAEDDVVADDEATARANDPQTIVNSAVTLSAMRALMMQECPMVIPDVPTTEMIPPVVARIVVGGRVEGYSGFVPGVFEETLVTLELQRPTYLLGGFGGATEILAEAILTPGADRPPQLTLEWHQQHNERLVQLLESKEEVGAPAGTRSTAELLDALFAFVQKARADPAATLNTGLSPDDTRELLKTRDTATAVRLVWNGLTEKLKLSQPT